MGNAAQSLFAFTAGLASLLGRGYHYLVPIMGSHISLCVSVLPPFHLLPHMSGLCPTLPLSCGPTPTVWVVLLLRLVLSACPLVSLLPFILDHAGTALLIYPGPVCALCFTL